MLCIEEEFQEGSRVQRVEMPKTMRHRNLLTRSDLLLPQWAKQKQQEGEKRSEQPTPTFEDSLAKAALRAAAPAASAAILGAQNRRRAAESSHSQ